jgi:hypothetical protein
MTSEDVRLDTAEKILGYRHTGRCRKMGVHNSNLRCKRSTVPAASRVAELRQPLHTGRRATPQRDGRRISDLGEGALVEAC